MDTHKSTVAGLAFICLMLYSLCNQVSPLAAEHIKADGVVIATPPFSLTDDVLKGNTKGVDVDALIALGLKNKLPVKSEYETNIDYEERLKKLSGSYFPPKIGRNRIAIVQSIAAFPTLFWSGPSSVEAKYNAETETMSVRINDWLSCIPLKRNINPKRQYSATNRFGYKVNVIEVDEIETCLGVGKDGEIKKVNLAFNFAVSKKEAPTVKPILAIVVIGRLGLPFATEEKRYYAPTAREPIGTNSLSRSLVVEVEDVWVINTVTGMVFAKEKTLMANAAPMLRDSVGYDRTCDPPAYSANELPNFNLVVELEFLIESDGSVVSGSVKKSTGISELDNRALKAFSSCKFKPGTKDGRPSRGAAIVKFNFSAPDAGVLRIR